jgi:hypothetical protein
MRLRGTKCHALRVEIGLNAHMAKTSRSQAVTQLGATLRNPTTGLRTMLAAGPVVLARYQPIFAPEHLPKLTEEEFRSFLVFKNNQHWVGLQRSGSAICADMKKLRKSLAVLLDDSIPIEQRLDRLAPGGRDSIHRLGRAVITAILMVAHPEKFGVWNARSEGTMKELGLWPTLRGADSFGSRYRRVNDTMIGIAKELGTDLWTLDGLWWAVMAGAAPADADQADLEARPEDGSREEQSFGLERHLHDFLYDNWSRTVLGKEWELYTEDGDEVGMEYQTPIGRIDLLARHRSGKRWLVIELKRAQTSDQTLGQVMRYIGFVEKELAQKGDRVEGLIIAQGGDEQLKYALAAAGRVKLMCYRVDFRLEAGG